MLEYFNLEFGAKVGAGILDKIQQDGGYYKKNPSKKVLKNLLKIAKDSKKVLAEPEYDNKLKLYYSIFSYEEWDKKNILNYLADDTINTLEKMIDNEKVSKGEVKNSSIFFKNIASRCITLGN